MCPPLPDTGSAHNFLALRHMPNACHKQAGRVVWPCCLASWVVLDRQPGPTPYTRQACTNHYVLFARAPRLHAPRLKDTATTPRRRPELLPFRVLVPCMARASSTLTEVHHPTPSPSPHVAPFTGASTQENLCTSGLSQDITNRAGVCQGAFAVPAKPHGQPYKQRQGRHRRQ